MSVFLIEHLITRYSEIALSDNAIIAIETRLVNEAVSKLKFKLINVKGCFSLLEKILDINMDLDFNATDDNV